ncbi:hypothetical protein ACFORL_06950 [Legionella dresdenensis]|uniref:Uncharacterized protein n=1 Tax=Legionella dresdenensis TaxID=450200 RepID=A0ABV8CFR9_9GAMM
MFRFYPNGFSSSEIRQYTAFNGVLCISNYNPKDFHADLLVGFNPIGKLVSLSSTFCKEENSCLQKHMFSMSINEASELTLTFNSCCFYVETLKIPDEVLANLENCLTYLYHHSHYQTAANTPLNPKPLLLELASCVAAHSAVAKENQGNMEEIVKNIPFLIQAITDTFYNEVERFETSATMSLS